MDAADIVINFESYYIAPSGSNDASYAPGQAHSWRLLDWEKEYPPERFWHLVHGTSQADMATAIRLSKQRNAAWVYVTDDVMDNPWNVLATYWDAELAKAGSALADKLSFFAERGSALTRCDRRWTPSRCFSSRTVAADARLRYVRRAQRQTHPLCFSSRQLLTPDYVNKTFNVAHVIVSAALLGWPVRARRLVPSWCGGTGSTRAYSSR